MWTFIDVWLKDIFLIFPIVKWKVYLNLLLELRRLVRERAELVLEISNIYHTSDTCLEATTVLVAVLIAWEAACLSTVLQNLWKPLCVCSLEMGNPRQEVIFTSLKHSSVASHCTRLVLEHTGKSLRHIFFQFFVNSVTYVTWI